MDYLDIPHFSQKVNPLMFSFPQEEQIQFPLRFASSTLSAESEEWVATDLLVTSFWMFAAAFRIFA